METRPLQPLCNTCGQPLAQVAPVTPTTMEMRCVNSNCLAFDMRHRFPIQAPDARA